MRDLLDKIQAKTREARDFQNKGDITGARAALDEISSLKAQYENEKQIYELEKDNVPDDPKPQNKVDGFSVMCKVARREALTAAENALVTGGTNGEDYLIPEDVHTEIINLRRACPSMREVITTIPTNSIKGTFNFEEGGISGLENFDDGNDITDTGDPKVVQTPFACAQYGKIIGISNRLIGNERAQLLAYLNQWFVKKAVFTENKKIFEMLVKDKTAVVIDSADELRVRMTVDINTGIEGSVIVTNQHGMAWLATQKDGDGKSLLVPDHANPAVMRFNGATVKGFPNTHLANVDNQAPIFYGSLKDGAYLIESESLHMAASDDALFSKNQKALRVIEDFDVIQADKDAYGYGLVDISGLPGLDA